MFFCAALLRCLGLETSRLSFNLLVLVLGHKVLVLVLSWTIQALVLGGGSSEPCTKLRLYEKGVIFPKKPNLRVFWGYTCSATIFFSVICSTVAVRDVT